MGCDWSKSARVAHDPEHEELKAHANAGQEKGAPSQLAVHESEVRDFSETAPREAGFLAVHPTASAEEEKPAAAAARPKLGISALRPLPKKPEEAGLRPVPSTERDKVPACPSKLPPLVVRGGSDPAKNKPAKPGGKGLGLSLQVEKAKELPRERTEREIRTEKLRRYERECNKVREFLFVGGELAAANRELLLALGISHVINMAAKTIPCHFPEAFGYTPLLLDDAPGEDIACHLYTLLRIIDSARQSGGRVLVHCHQGVSRSCSVCIAYLMLYEGMSYDQGFQTVKTARGICNPNAGFCSQLVMWGRCLVRGGEPRGNEAPRLRAYRIGDYRAADAVEQSDSYDEVVRLAPKLITASGGRVVLESDRVYVLDSAEAVYVWEGRGASGAHRECGREHVRAIQEFEGAAAAAQRVEEIRDGEETAEVMEMLRTLRCLLPSQSDASREESAAVQDQSTPMSVEDEGTEETAGQHHQESGEGGSAGCRTRGAVEERKAVSQVVPGLKLGGEIGLPVQAKGCGQERAPVVGMAGDGWGGGERTGGGGLQGVSASKSVGESGDDDEEEGGGEGRKRMFEVKEAGGWREEWEELHKFDSDDLWSEKAYIVLDRTDDASEAFVWLGSACPAVPDIQDGEACAALGRELAVAFTRKTGLAVESITTVCEGDEPDEFWDCFELG